MAEELLELVKSEDIDIILDEIDENENKLLNKNPTVPTNVSWEEIISQMRAGKTNYIKNLITSKDIAINAQNPKNGLTLLHYAVVIGNYDLVKALCNFGADVNITNNDGDDVFKYAVKYGRYKITELIFYPQLSGSLGKDLKNIATQIHLKNKEAHNIMQ